MTPSQQQAVNLTFLSLTIWRESRGESTEAQLAVAYSILTRVARGGWWGTDILSVIGKKWQYSSMAAPGDPQLIVWPQSNDPSWDACLNAAQAALTGTPPNPAPGADSYYDDSINPPGWAQAPAMRVAKIGRLNFWKVG